MASASGREATLHMRTPASTAHPRNPELDSMLSIMARSEKPVDACAATAACIPAPSREPTAPSTRWTYDTYMLDKSTS
jgi:hypothetical protein